MPLEGAAEGSAEGAAVPQAVLGVSRPSRGFTGAARAQRGRGDPAAEGAAEGKAGDSAPSLRESGTLKQCFGSEIQLPMLRLPT